MNTNKKIQKIVAAAFIHKDGKLLIARRSSTKSFLPGVYELPGGHIEFGETMENGLFREIKEEFHVDVKIGDPFYVFTYTDKNNTAHAIEVDYFATLVDSDQNIELNAEDHSEFRWVGREDFLNFFIGNEAEGEAAKKGFTILNKKN
ncbi:MAG: NUDIX domain-containing protein [Parcubacteria group bacterium]|jgi:8-oxo-dGTP diphosphatase